MNADSAQPRKASNVTRPFPILWVGSGDETISRGEPEEVRHDDVTRALRGSRNAIKTAESAPLC